MFLCVVVLKWIRKSVCFNFDVHVSLSVGRRRDGCAAEAHVNILKGFLKSR